MDDLRPKHEIPLTETLKKSPPPKRNLLPFLVILAVIVLVRVAFSFMHDQTKEPIAIPTVPSFQIKEDPDKLQREKLIQESKDIALLWKSPEDNTEKNIQELGKIPAGHFRVAAAQIHSRMGDAESNRKKMARYIEKAASLGVNILVFPEACVPGYCDLDTWSFWATDPKAEFAKIDFGTFLDVSKAAEPFDGESFRFFSALAKKYHMYITVPYIEIDRESGNYYNSLTLLAPDGSIAMRYRKQHLWALGDPYWASEGNFGTLVCDSPYGSIGVMICYDMHRVLEELAEKKASIVLHSTAFYGMNFDAWLNFKYSKLVAKANVQVVLANWASLFVPDWDGFGLSRILNRSGKAVASQGAKPGEVLVVGDLPLPPESTGQEKDKP